MREFRKVTGRSVRDNTWFIGIDPKSPDTYITKWGLLDGAMQETSDTPGDCGVEGHANYQTPEEYVIFCMDREIRKKEEQGYVEYINGKPVKKVITKVDFDKQLPKNLCFYKPKKEISDKKMIALEKSGKAIWTLKRDGMMHVAVKGSTEWTIYSRRMDVVTDKYPHIIESLNKLKVPKNSVLLGEMVFLKKDGRDDFKLTSRICRSDPDLSLAYQGMGDFPKSRIKESVLGKVSYYVFDIGFYGGKELARSSSVRERFTLLRSLFSPLGPKLHINTGLVASSVDMRRENKARQKMLKTHHIGPVQIVDTNAKTDLELAKDLKIEGFVLFDADAVFGDKGFSFDGKAQRPNGIWKRKPKYEDEFIITGIYEGSGRNRGKLGGFTLEQVHPETEKRIDCGKCGGGLSDEQREDYWRRGKKLVGKTIKCEFDSRQPPKDGVYALRFPVFKGFADKTQAECIAQNLGE
jgi:ATP-dependent DNA ligase